MQEQKTYPGYVATYKKQQPRKQQQQQKAKTKNQQNNNTNPNKDPLKTTTNPKQ